MKNKIHHAVRTVPKLKWLWFMVFNITLNNISVISCWSVLFVKETGVPGENHHTKFVETGKIIIPDTNIHDRSFSGLVQTLQ